MRGSCNRGQLFVIIGPDGSGKTTLARTVATRLRKDSLDIDYVWCRFESRYLASFLRLISRIRNYEGDLDQASSRRERDKKRLMQYSLSRWIFTLFVLLSYMIEIHSKIVRPLRSGRCVISDRYVHDTAVDLWIDFGSDRADIARLIAILQSIAPKPTLLFLMDVPEVISMKRKNDIPSLAFIAERRKGYLVLSESVNGLMLDGAIPPERNALRICDAIRRELEGSG